jgi:hypothetical protein
MSDGQLRTDPSGDREVMARFLPEGSDTTTEAYARNDS